MMLRFVSLILEETIEPERVTMHISNKASSIVSIIDVNMCLTE